MKKVRKYQLKVIVEERIMSDLYSEVSFNCRTLALIISKHSSLNFVFPAFHHGNVK